MPIKKAPAKPVHKKVAAVERMTAVSGSEEAPAAEPMPAAPRMMQVVEVEEEQPAVTTPQTASAEATPEPQAERPVQTASSPTPTIASEDDIEDGSPDESAREREAEVVSGLFRKEVPEVFPEIAVHKAGLSLKPVYFWAITVIVAAVIIGIGLLAVGRGGFKIAGKKVQPTPAPTVAATPTPSPTPSIVKKDIKVQILNGSGKAGVAGAMKKLLEEKGYTVSGTGNAKAYTYTKTEINTKASPAGLGDAIKEDISGSYSVGSVSATLSASETVHAVVIVGKE